MKFLLNIAPVGLFVVALILLCLAHMESKYNYESLESPMEICQQGTEIIVTICPLCSLTMCWRMTADDVAHWRGIVRAAIRLAFV